MNPFVRFLFVGVVAWQAGAATLAHARRIVAGGDAGLATAVAATTDERIQGVLGADAMLVRELRRLLPAGTVVLNQQVTGSLEELRAATPNEQELVAAFARLSAKNGLFVQLTALLFPAPFLLSVPAPIAAVEHEVAAGRDRWLFVLQGDPEPRDRAGWTCVHLDPRFSLWRFRTGS